MPRINLSQCQYKDYEQVIVDESNIVSSEIKEKDSDNED